METNGDSKSMKNCYIWLMVIGPTVILFLYIVVTLVVKEDKHKLNVVKDIEPVWQLDAERHQVLDDLKTIPTAQRGAYLQQRWPQLDNDLVVFLKDRGTIPSNAEVEEITYAYGSAVKVKAEDLKRFIHDGEIRNELIASVKVKGIKKPVLVAVRCLNGLFELEGDFFQEVASRNFISQFTIRRGEGLCHHVSYPVAIRLAERFKLPIYKSGRNIPEQKISVEEALVLENQTDQIQVMVRVYPQDHFDLNNMTYNGHSVN